MAPNAKYCKICASNLKDFTKLSPQDHERAHGDDERACGQCWEAWLSLQVEEKKPDEIECLFCESPISEADFTTLARKATTIRYSMKKLLKEGVTCMNRCKDSLKTNRDYNRERDGRVFTCQHCDFQFCFDCDRPEHIHESCDEYRERQQAIHGHAEALTFKICKTCPDCNATIKPLKSNCHTQCEGCGHQFCSGCMVNWVGEGGAYLLGKEAHTGEASTVQETRKASTLLRTVGSRQMLYRSALVPKLRRRRSERRTGRGPEQRRSGRTVTDQGRRSPRRRARGQRREIDMLGS